ncbi:MAG: hypothetical protein ACREJ3_01910 [Polyangiaceae bacterium]
MRGSGGTRPHEKPGAATVTIAAGKSVDDLRLSVPVASVLKDIQAEIAEAYRDRFIEMMDVLRQQTSALDRIQKTIHVLVQAVRPELAGTVPAAVRVARDGESPDLASSIVVADPIGAGYTLSQVDLAKALGLPNATDISVLVRAFKLGDNGECAVTVRRGARNKIVNYHPRAVDTLRKWIDKPPGNLALTPEQLGAVKRIRKKLAPTVGS